MFLSGLLKGNLDGLRFVTDITQEILSDYMPNYLNWRRQFLTINKGRIDSFWAVALAAAGHADRWTV